MLRCGFIRGKAAGGRIAVIRQTVLPPGARCPPRPDHNTYIARHGTSTASSPSRPHYTALHRPTRHESPGTLNTTRRLGRGSQFARRWRRRLARAPLAPTHLELEVFGHDAADLIPQMFDLIRGCLYVFGLGVLQPETEARLISRLYVFGLGVLQPREATLIIRGSLYVFGLGVLQPERPG